MEAIPAFEELCGLSGAAGNCTVLLVGGALIATAAAKAAEAVIG